MDSICLHLSPSHYPISPSSCVHFSSFHLFPVLPLHQLNPINPLAVCVSVSFLNVSVHLTPIDAGKPIFTCAGTLSMLIILNTHPHPPEDEDEEHKQHAECGHVVHGFHQDNELPAQSRHEAHQL